MRQIFPPDAKIRNKTLSPSQVMNKFTLMQAPSSKIVWKDYKLNTVTTIEPVMLYFPVTVKVKVRETDLSLTPIDAFGSEVRYFVWVNQYEQVIPPKRPKNIRTLTTTTLHVM